MSKRTVFTTITALPVGVTRASVMETLYNHVEMIDLNPLVEERHPIKPPAKATGEEYHCLWYSITDKVSYLPGGLVSGKVTYDGCFHDLANGLQTHVYAPMGLDIKGKWTLGGSLPGETSQPVEIGIGVPLTGLYLREDVDMKCNIFMTSFVKKTIKRAHAALVDRLLVKAQLAEKAAQNDRISEITYGSTSSSPHMSISQAASIRRMGSPGFPAQASPGFPQGSPGFAPQGMHAEGLALRSQAPPSSGRLSYQQPHDSRYSSQTLASHNSFGSPGYQVDPAYQNANPYYQQQQHPMTMQMQMQLGQGHVYAPSELASNEESLRDQKRGGPPSHTFAPVELPAEVLK
jgi:hypothetical protein